MISHDLTTEEETELLSFLDKNNYVFTWKTSDLMGVSRSITEHKCHVNPSAKPRKQKLCKMSNKKYNSQDGGLEAAGCRFHTRGRIANMVSKCSRGQEEEWQVENVYIFH
jgi:hypothetical protein